MEHEEELEREGTQLRERIEALDRAPTAPYPEQIREDVAAFIERARSGIDKWAWKRLAEELGVNHTTLSQWYDKYAGSRQLRSAEQMVPVRLETDAGPGSAARSTEGLVLEVGAVRLEGLGFEQAVEAARRLK